jgi:hypothetical protein
MSAITHCPGSKRDNAQGQKLKSETRFEPRAAVALAMLNVSIGGAKQI